MAGDLYLVLGGYDVQTQVAEFKMFINPLVNWIWLGVGIMVFGSVIAFLPERTFAFATAEVPAGAATTLLVLLAVLAGGTATVRAQHVEMPNTVIVPPKSSLEKDMQGSIICMCGTCGRKKVWASAPVKPAAGHAHRDCARLTAAGKTRDEIIQYFINEYGSQEVLSQPIDRGFKPAGVVVPSTRPGSVGILVVGGTAMRWSRRHGRADDLPPAPLDLGARLAPGS